MSQAPSPTPGPPGHDQSTTDHPGRDRPGGISGRWIIAATLSLVVIVPILTYVAFQIAARDLRQPPPPLKWSEHGQWEFLPTKGTTMRRGEMSSARTGERYYDYSFKISPDQEQAIHRTADLARHNRAAFKADAVGQKLKAITAAHPKMFYPAYVLGVWHKLRGEAAPARRWYGKALALSPVVLRQPYTDAQAHRLAGQPVPPLAFTLDRVRSDVLDVSLVLVYPPNVTDDQGEVYLPIYRMIYREVDPEQATRMQPRHPNDDWFTFPGRFGERPARTIVEPAAKQDKANGPASHERG